MFKKISVVAAGLALAATLGACGVQSWDDYAGPPYVTGTGTCVNPQTGMPEYCVELSSGYSQMVPFGIYSTIGYGSVLSYSHSHYTVTRTSYYRPGRAPDLYSVRLRTAPRNSGYSGMSYMNKGRVVYRSPSARSVSISSYRSSSSRH